MFWRKVGQQTITRRRGPIAQLVEQRPFKPRVASSNLAGPSIFLLLTMSFTSGFYGEPVFALPFGEGNRKQVLEESEHEPTWHISSYADFDIRVLLDEGVRHALLDLDGHLSPAYHHTLITPEAERALHIMRRGFATVSLATNSEWYLGHVMARFGLDYSFQPKQAGTDLPYKPCDRYFNHILEVLEVPPETIVMAGDNPIHDMAAAEYGMKTLLVDRLDPHGFFDPKPTITIIT